MKVLNNYETIKILWKIKTWNIEMTKLKIFRSAYEQYRATSNDSLLEGGTQDGTQELEWF
jgi:hypothetical protein